MNIASERTALTQAIRGDIYPGSVVYCVRGSEYVRGVVRHVIHGVGISVLFGEDTRQDVALVDLPQLFVKMD